MERIEEGNMRGRGQDMKTIGYQMTNNVRGSYEIRQAEKRNTHVNNYREKRRGVGG